MTEKTIPTQFRLTETEREFLLARGMGNMTTGLRDIVEENARLLDLVGLAKKELR